ncbi:MAG: restriction endonuclease subunit S [Fibrobacteraceae bacterium]|nr:restriction endonuclease subunit S [Fibrobacteraceae bacterium]
MKKYKLGDIAEIVISSVDKKTKPGEKIVRLCNFTDVYHNWAIKQSDYDSFMVASASDSNINKLSLKKGFVAFTKDSETRDDIGISTYIADDFDDVVLGYHCALAKPNEKIVYGKYLNAFMSSDYIKKYFELNATGSGMRFTLAVSTMEDMPIMLPSLNVQKKIGDVLSDFDQRIENLRAQNRVLEQTAKTIYDYTFLQCAGHQTTYNKTLNRNIPVGWEVCTIGNYIKENKGGDWGKENPEKNYNLRVSCIRGADIDKMTDLPIRYILAKNSSRLLQEFDLVVEISGGSPTQSTGRSRLMTKELLEMFDNKLICSNFCQAITMKNPQYAYYISFMWKMFYDNGIFFNFEGKTSGIKNFQLDQFVDTMWFFPNLKTVEKFNAQVAPLIKKQLFNAKQIEALTTQRNTLLPLLMTGQIEV